MGTAIGLSPALFSPPASPSSGSAPSDRQTVRPTRCAPGVWRPDAHRRCWASSGAAAFPPEDLRFPSPRSRRGLRPREPFIPYGGGIWAPQNASGGGKTAAPAIVREKTPTAAWTARRAGRGIRVWRRRVCRGSRGRPWLPGSGGLPARPWPGLRGRHAPRACRSAPEPRWRGGTAACRGR